MNDKKSVYLKVQVDNKTDQAFRKILEIKGLTIQSVLEEMLKIGRFYPYLTNKNSIIAIIYLKLIIKP